MKNTLQFDFQSLEKLFYFEYSCFSKASKGRLASRVNKQYHGVYETSQGAPRDGRNRTLRKANCAIHRRLCRPRPASSRLAWDRGRERENNPHARTSRVREREPAHVREHARLARSAAVLHKIILCRHCCFLLSSGLGFGSAVGRLFRGEASKTTTFLLGCEQQLSLPPPPRATDSRRENKLRRSFSTPTQSVLSVIHLSLKGCCSLLVTLIYRFFLVE